MPGPSVASLNPGLVSAVPTAVAAVPTAATATPTIEPTRTPDPTSNRQYPEQTPRSAAIAAKPGRVFSHGDISRTEVFITIDDCRNWANIEKDLETAKEMGVQLTLFPAGKYIDAYQADAATALRKAVAYGDEIGNHTYTHTFIEQDSTANWKGDLDAQMAAVRKALNDPDYKEWFVRPPYGSGLNNVSFATATLKDQLSIALWSIDSGGYEDGSTVSFAMKNVFDTGHFKNGAIILMHDDDTDTAALPLIIKRIKAQGFSVGGDLKNILIDG